MTWLVNKDGKIYRMLGLIGNQDGMTRLLASNWECRIDWQPRWVDRIISFQIGMAKCLKTKMG
jgi:hypothetical protein